MVEKKVTYIDENGVKVTIAPMAKPRASEKTFRNNKFTIAYQGRQGMRFGRQGVYGTV